MHSIEQNRRAFQLGKDITTFFESIHTHTLVTSMYQIHTIIFFSCDLHETHSEVRSSPEVQCYLEESLRNI